MVFLENGVKILVWDWVYACVKRIIPPRECIRDRYSASAAVRLSQKSRNAISNIPAFLYAPSRIRTYDTLIKSQVL